MNDSLNKLLTSWEVETPELSAFQRNVWQRIAASEVRSQSGFSLWVEWMESLVSVSRPKIAIVAACTAVIFGVIAGNYFPAQNEFSASAYLRSVNPYAQVAFRL